MLLERIQASDQIYCTHSVPDCIKTIHAHYCILKDYLHYLVDRSDPFASAASQHFNSLLQRFGSPVMVFNLVKVCVYETLNCKFLHISFGK